MKRIDVVKKGEKWVGENKGKTVPKTAAPRKTDAVKNTAKVARKSPDPVSVKIHNENGRIQEERTYPGTADPRKTKG